MTGFYFDISENWERSIYEELEQIQENSIDIIVCKGNNWLLPPNPLLYGSRNKELNSTKNKLHHISMVDLDWEDVNWTEYYHDLVWVRSNRYSPIKYVVIPDLEDITKFEKTIKFGQQLIDQNIAKNILLPIKIDVNLNNLPKWIRPSLPTKTGYKDKKNSEIDYSSFKKYTGEIHVLGGSNFGEILATVGEYAPDSIIKSVDFSTFTWLAGFGKVFNDNCTSYDHIPKVDRDGALAISYDKLIKLHKRIGQLPNTTYKQINMELNKSSKIFSQPLKDFL